MVGCDHHCHPSNWTILSTTEVKTLHHKSFIIVIIISRRFALESFLGYLFRSTCHARSITRGFPPIFPPSHLLRIALGPHSHVKEAPRGDFLPLGRQISTTIHHRGDLYTCQNPSCQCHFKNDWSNRGGSSYSCVSSRWMSTKTLSKSTQRGGLMGIFSCFIF